MYTPPVVFGKGEDYRNGNLSSKKILSLM